MAGVIGWSPARHIAYAAGTPLPAIHVELHQARGRVLAEPLVSLTPLPAFDAAAMDGWAVRGDGPWRVVGRVLAGHPQDLRLDDGTAVEIATGALVPVGADGVLPYEQGRQEAATLTGPSPRVRHVRRAGEECDAGQELLAAGTQLNPAGLGLAAAAGHDSLLVHPAPRVAVLVTGDELLFSGLPGDGRIRDAVGPMLPGAVAWCGGELVARHSLGDDIAALRRALDEADAEVVVTTGASSVGRADHLPAALAALGAVLLVDGVAVRPGHPQVLARLPDGRFVVGLPGNPLAALAGVVTLLQPLLAGLAGRPLPVPDRVRAGEDLPATHAGVRLVPVAIRSGAAVPTGHGAAAMLRGAAQADAFAVVPEGDGVRASADVDVVALPR